MNSLITKVNSLIIVMVFATNCTPKSATLQASISPVAKAHADRKPINYFNTFWVKSPMNVSSHLRCVFQDHKGNYWFGTDGYGVCRYDGKYYTYYSAEDGLGNNYVHSIREDKEGIWFTTLGGVSRYNGFSFVNFPGPGKQIVNEKGKNDGC